jgi:transcriptional regulator with XRE-family HTH domain
MNCEVLGKKLKEARLAKKMTQSDVVGNYITRNMLSQIESGAAFPSIRTLEYLSGVLEVPMAELLADAEDNGDSTICPKCGHEFKK